MRPHLTWQPALDLTSDQRPGAATGAPLRAGGIEHADLGAGAWLDWAPRWVRGADDLFARLLDEAPWRARTVPMYGRRVLEPRLTAWWSVTADDPALPTGIAPLAAALSARYGLTMDRVGAALYRDGRDSVAMHGDRIARERRDPPVAIVSLGSPRRLVIQAIDGAWRRNVTMRSGDLLVMGGTTQRHCLHGVPKVARTGPRISLQFRPDAADQSRIIGASPPAR